MLILITLISLLVMSSLTRPTEVDPSIQSILNDWHVKARAECYQLVVRETFDATNETWHGIYCTVCEPEPDGDGALMAIGSKYGLRGSRMKRHLNTGKHKKKSKKAKSKAKLLAKRESNGTVDDWASFQSIQSAYFKRQTENGTFIEGEWVLNVEPGTTKVIATCNICPESKPYQVGSNPKALHNFVRRHLEGGGHLDIKSALLTKHNVDLDEIDLLTTPTLPTICDTMPASFPGQIVVDGSSPYLEAQEALNAIAPGRFQMNMNLTSYTCLHCHCDTFKFNRSSKVYQRTAKVHINCNCICNCIACNCIVTVL